MNAQTSLNVALAKYPDKTLEELAELMKKSIHTVKKYANGKIRMNDFQIALCAAYFGLKGSEFIALGEK